MTTSRNDSHSITPLASLRPIAKLVFGGALPAHGACANPSMELRERIHLKNLIKLLDQGSIVATASRLPMAASSSP